jgi:hypothetical protein
MYYIGAKVPTSRCNDGRYLKGKKMLPNNIPTKRGPLGLKFVPRVEVWHLGLKFGTYIGLKFNP